MADAVKKPAATTSTKEKKPHVPRNWKIPGGVWRFSQSTMYSKKRIYKIKKTVTPKEKSKKKPKTVVKPIGGEKNGGTRVVKLKKEVFYYIICLFLCNQVILNCQF